MNICIIGWYGTETMGDRAILDGILKIVTETFSIEKIYLGSLFPFFSQRTLYEDGALYCENKIKIEIFYEKNLDELEKYIGKSDILIMGGGPLMDINDMYIIRKGFRIAKKKEKMTIIMGCGFGAFHNRRIHAVADEILRLTDLCILRDDFSKERAKAIKEDVYHLPDPAIYSMLYYKNTTEINRKSTRVVVNLKEVDLYQCPWSYDITDELRQFLSILSDLFEEVLLVPMQTFYAGGDDRIYLSEFRDNEKINIQYKPLNLYELYEVYSSAHACVGMRHHSVVMQTVLNGNNVIIDYTEPHIGKISGFLAEIPNSDFYRDRYFNFEDKKIDISKYVEKLSGSERYLYRNDKNMLDSYRGLLVEYYERK